jgi:hypothetical protein
VIIGLPQGVGGLGILFYCISFHFFHFNITHQVLVGLPQGVGGLGILFYFILVFLEQALGARRAATWGWWLRSFIIFVLFVFHFIIL